MPAGLPRVLRPRRCLGAAAAAATELALIAPMLSLMLVMLVDLGKAFEQRIQIVSAVAAGAEFAYLAEQNGVVGATIITETESVIVAASNSLLTTSDISIVVNDGNSWADRCCISGGAGSATTWSCGAAGSTTCADGSSPGVYVTISASYPFVPFFSADTRLTGKTLNSTVVARVL